MTFCHAISDESICNICQHPLRKEAKQLCIVEDVRDVLAIEGTGEYKGLYHVLGGVIAPMRHIEADDLHIQSLYRRIEQSPTSI